jgi:hypothetical protein
VHHCPKSVVALSAPLANITNINNRANQRNAAVKGRENVRSYAAKIVEPLKAADISRTIEQDLFNSLIGTVAVEHDRLMSKHIGVSVVRDKALFDSVLSEDNDIILKSIAGIFRELHLCTLRSLFHDATEAELPEMLAAWERKNISEDRIDRAISENIITVADAVKKKGPRSIAARTLRAVIVSSVGPTELARIASKHSLNLTYGKVARSSGKKDMEHMLETGMDQYRKSVPFQDLRVIPILK